MAFFSLPAEVESLAHDIHKFQRNIDKKKAFGINFTLQRYVERVAIIKPLDLPLFDASKRKIRVAASVSSRFYNFS